MSCVICARISTVRLTEKMGELGFIQWPCRDTSDADQGTSYLFKEKFDTPNGLAQFFTCDWVAPISRTHRRVPDGTVNGA